MKENTIIFVKRITIGENKCLFDLIEKDNTYYISFGQLQRYLSPVVSGLKNTNLTKMVSENGYKRFKANSNYPFYGKSFMPVDEMWKFIEHCIRHKVFFVSNRYEQHVIDLQDTIGECIKWHHADEFVEEVVPRRSDTARENKRQRALEDKMKEIEENLEKEASEEASGDGTVTAYDDLDTMLEVIEERQVSIEKQLAVVVQGLDKLRPLFGILSRIEKKLDAKYTEEHAAIDRFDDNLAVLQSVSDQFRKDKGNADLTGEHIKKVFEMFNIKVGA